MRHSTSSWQKPHSRQPSYSWVTSTCQMSAGNTTERKQPRKFLEYVEDNFLTQLVNEPSRGGAMLFVSKEGLVGAVVASGHLGQSDCKLLRFSILVK